jgi:hypothetical protein
MLRLAGSNQTARAESIFGNDPDVLCWKRAQTMLESALVGFVGRQINTTKFLET